MAADDGGDPVTATNGSIDTSGMVPKVQKRKPGAIPAAVSVTLAFALAVAATAFAVLNGPSLGVAASMSIAGGGFVLLAAAILLALRSVSSQQNQTSLQRLIGEAVERGNSPVLVTDGEGRVVYCNDQASLLFGDVTPDADRELTAVLGLSGKYESEIKDLTGAVRKEGRGEGLIRHTAADGTRRWYNARAVYFVADDRTLWDLDDVTARQDLEQMVAEQQTELSGFLDNAPIGFYAIDRDGKFLFVNSTLASWLGRSRGDLIGGDTKIVDVVAEDGAATIGADALTTGGVQGRIALTGRRGNVFLAEISQKAVYGNEGNMLYARAAVRDLTQEVALETTLRQSRDSIGRFFDDAPIGIATVDGDGIVVETNDAFREMSGSETGNLSDTPFTSLVSHDDKAEVTALIEGALSGKQRTDPTEARILGPNQCVAQLFASKVTDHDGAVSGAVIHLIDTTEQKNLEMQFAQSQKMQAVGQLAGGIAHDFNNLLTAMIGFCDLLLMRHQAGDESFSDIMQIKQNANRAANLVRQLLAFSRQQTLRPKVLDVTDVLSELSHLLRRLIGENIQLNMTHGRDLGLVKADHGQIEQVIINLAVNARDAMAGTSEGGGELSIGTSNVTVDESMRLSHELMPPGNYVMIEVGDTGHGIPGEHLGKIFEPFFTTKEVGAGTGLGLSTVYGIVKQTGGYIFPDSKPGKGATFRIYLPQYVQEEGGREAAEVADEPATARDLTGKGLVLLVEDEDAVRTFAARALRNKGYTVLEADSGESALKVVDDHDDTIDLLISDVVMPQMDGPTLVKHIRESRPETKIIFISGYAEDAFRKNLDGDAREISFLPKPFSLKQLAGKVKEVMAAEHV